MWLTKSYLMDEFADEVQKGNYKKLEYFTWRDLQKHTPEEWDINIEVNLHNYSEEDSRTMTVSWDGCDWPYEFSIKDNSFGEFLWNLLKDYDNEPIKFDLNTTTMASSLAKCAEATGKAISTWSTSLSDTWEKLQQQLTVSDRTYETKPPALEVTENGIVIGGKTIEQLMDEATGASITTRKENNNMNLFKNFDFGSCANDNVKVSMYGVAVKNANGTWVSYDPKTGNVIDVDILNFDAKYLYKMPVAIKDVKPGDVVIHNRKPMFVVDIDGSKLDVIDPAAGEEKIVLLTKSMFGFDFVTKVVNFLGNISAGASEDAPFGNILPLMLLADGGNKDDLLPLMFLMGGGKCDMTNPMFLYALMSDKGNSKDNLLPFMLFANGQGIAYGKAETCDKAVDH